MFVFDVIKPGSFLDYEDRLWASRINGQLNTIEGVYLEANAALDGFIRAHINLKSSIDSQELERKRIRRGELSSEAERSLGRSPSFEEFLEISHDSDVVVNRESWLAGTPPTSFITNRCFIYAKAFLYSLDNFEKLLAVLLKEDGVPQAISQLHKEFELFFPELRGVRNTSHHLEDRSRGLGAGRVPKKMDIKPVNNSAYSMPEGGVLILNSLNGTKYGSTMANGEYGEVDVSVASMKEIQRIFGSILESFKWSGRKTQIPS